MSVPAYPDMSGVLRLPEAMESRWRRLMGAIGHMASDFSVSGRLERTLDAAVATVGARCAAIVVDRSDDHTVERVVYSSDDPDDMAALRTVIEASHGGAGDATDRPVIVVPLHTEDGERSGTLYTLGRTSPAPAFTADDKLLVASLADTAGVALACAAAHEQARHRGDWLSALASVNLTLMQRDHHPVQLAQSVADLVLGLTQARTVTIEIPDPNDPGHLEVRIAAGQDADQLVGHRYRREGSVADAAMLSGRGCRWQPDSDSRCSHATAPTTAPVGEALAAPLKGSTASRGVIVASRAHGAPRFKTPNRHMLQDFARQVVFALEVAESRQLEEQLRRSDERERLAKTLQDNVIQRLFAAGLQLQALNRSRLGSPEIDQVLEGIDESIRQVRLALKS